MSLSLPWGNSCAVCMSATVQPRSSWRPATRARSCRGHRTQPPGNSSPVFILFICLGTHGVDHIEQRPAFAVGKAFWGQLCSGRGRWGAQRLTKKRKRRGCAKISHLFPEFEGRLATPGILPEHLNRGHTTRFLSLRPAIPIPVRY